MLDIALQAAGGRKIVEIRLAVGRFSAIVPASVAVFFDYLSRGTLAENARLVFETVPVALTCSDCGKTAALDIPSDVPVRPALAAALCRGCPCGGKALKVTGGLGFDLISLTVDEGGVIAVADNAVE